MNKHLYKVHGVTEVVFIHDPDGNQDPDEQAQDYLDEVETLEIVEGSLERIYETKEIPCGWRGQIPYGDEDNGKMCEDIINSVGSPQHIASELAKRGYGVPIEVLKEIL